MDKEIVLGPKAVEFISESLSYGLTLSKHLVDVVKLSRGRVTTVLPNSANLGSVEELANSILPLPPASEWHHHTDSHGQKTTIVRTQEFWSPAIDTIIQFLQTGEHNLCVLEDAMRDGSNRSKVVKPGLIMVTLGKEAYYVLQGGKYTPEHVEINMRQARYPWPPLVCVMTSLPLGQPRLAPGQSVSSDLLRMLAERTEKLAIMAYDGEAFVIWNRL